MCIYGGHMYIYLPNIKFLCLNLWFGKWYTDDANNASNTNDANDDARRTRHDCTRLFGNEPKNLLKLFTDKDEKDIVYLTFLFDKCCTFFYWHVSKFSPGHFIAFE